MLTLNKWFLGLSGDWIEITNQEKRIRQKKQTQRYNNSNSIKVSDKHF